MDKYCIKGSSKKSKLIKDYFQSIKGINRTNFSYDSENCYYYLSSHNQVCADFEIPEGYKEIPIGLIPGEIYIGTHEYTWIFISSFTLNNPYKHCGAVLKTDCRDGHNISDKGIVWHDNTNIPNLRKANSEEIEYFNKYFMEEYGKKYDSNTKKLIDKDSLSEYKIGDWIWVDEIYGYDDDKTNYIKTNNPHQISSVYTALLKFNSDEFTISTNYRDKFRKIDPYEIYIQGHTARGNEVKSILEKMGGTDSGYGYFTDGGCFYINNFNQIVWVSNSDVNSEIPNHTQLFLPELNQEIIKENQSEQMKLRPEKIYYIKTSNNEYIFRSKFDKHNLYAHSGCINPISGYTSESGRVVSNNTAFEELRLATKDEIERFENVFSEESELSEIPIIKGNIYYIETESGSKYVFKSDISQKNKFQHSGSISLTSKFKSKSGRIVINSHPYRELRLATKEESEQLEKYLNEFKYDQNPCQEIINNTKMNSIKVIYTNRYLDKNEKKSFKEYVFNCSEKHKLEIGDMIKSPSYSTKMQVVDVQNGSLSYFNGRAVKTIIIDSIIKNSQNKKKNMKTNSMMTSMVEKFKSQFIPTKVNGLKMTMTGDICVPSNGEYVAIDKDNKLISYPEMMTFDMPVYVINKPSSQLKKGDIVKHSQHSYSKVIGRTKTGKLSLLSYTGSTVYKSDIKDFIIGKSLIPTVVNMFGPFEGFDSTNGINPLMMLAMSDEDIDMKDMMMMSMMSGGNMGQMNPMMLMMMSDKSDSSSNMMEMMMMSQMMGGQNPFANMFEQK